MSPANAYHLVASLRIAAMRYASVAVANKVVSTSTVAKCESRTCRMAAERNTAAMRAVTRPATSCARRASTRMVAVPPHRHEATREERLGIGLQWYAQDGRDFKHAGEQIKSQRRAVEEMRVRIAGVDGKRAADRHALVWARLRVRKPEPDREQAPRRRER